ncbi:MAG: efflux RND transporter periplasmic adaptor subunit [Gammaproteobacteria bacterium]
MAGLLCVVTPATAFAQDGPTPVNTVEVATAPLHEEIPLTGSVTARRVSRLSPKVEGFVDEVLVDEGDMVSADDELVRLDPVMAEIDLSRVQAQLDEARARLKDARRQRREARELVKKQHIASTDYESTIAQVEINSAAQQRLQAELRRQQELLARHSIYAPFDGVVSEKLIEIGQWVETSTTLLELVEFGVLRIQLPVPQHYFSQVDIGTPVTMRFDALPDQVFDGAVTSKIPVGHTSARTFPVRIEVQNERGIIAPGMSARVRVKLKRSEQAVLLPRDAIIKKPDGSESVWLVDGEGDGLKANPVSVKTGRAYQEYVEILSDGLKAGDRVVIRGNEILRPGQAVRVTEELKPAL